jgi:hypothetical protein
VPVENNKARLSRKFVISRSPDHRRRRGRELR